MKKFFLSGVLAFAALLSVNAQDSQRIRFGVEAGYNNSSISTEETSSMSGFNAGVKLEVGLPNVLRGAYLSAGFKITTKSWKASVDWIDNDYYDGSGYYYEDYYTTRSWDDDDWDSYHITTKVKPYYLDIPIHIGYRFNVAPKASLFFEVGPYFDFGLFGKCTYSMSGDFYDYTLSGDAIDNVFTEEDCMKRFDVGIGAKIGAEFAKHYQISLGYDHGLNNVFKDTDESSKNRNFTVSVAYVF